MTQMTTDLLLTSPADDYMNAAQIDYFKGLLQRERIKLLEQLSTPAAEPEDPSSYPDPVDRASMEEERAQTIRDRCRVEARIVEIDRALKRIADDDGYGYCIETGDPIGIGRLLIQPTATLCVEAQARCEHVKRAQRF